jgi:hypothetical protein
VYFGTSEVSVAKNPGIYTRSPEVSVGRFENTKFRVENTKFQKWQHEVSGKIQHIKTSDICFFRSASKNPKFWITVFVFIEFIIMIYVFTPFYCTRLEKKLLEFTTLSLGNYI